MVVQLVFLDVNGCFSTSQLFSNTKSTKQFKVPYTIKSVIEVHNPIEAHPPCLQNKSLKMKSELADS